MALYLRGNVWWYEFMFLGQRIRESAHTTSKKLAIDIERERRRQLEQSAGGVRKHKPVLFSVAAKAWLAENAHWSESTREIYTSKLVHLGPCFGKLLLSDISASDISRYQRQRQREKASGRQINMETAVVRMILRQHRLWHLIEPDFRPMRENEEIGRALTDDEVFSLLAAAKKSRSRSLYPALVLLINTGMRVSELRHMRWRQVDMIERTVTVGNSKTEGGKGRLIPLNQEAFTVIAKWRAKFDNPRPDHFLFPSERYGFDGEEGRTTGMVAVYDIHPTRPIGSWKVAWTACRSKAKVSCRLHDLRHTFVSRLGAAKVADSTLTALSGWMSRKMLERYSHTRNEAKRHAVELLSSVKSAETESESPQNPPQQEGARGSFIQ
jgi:integrase